MEIRLYKSPWRAIRLMLLCSIFVLGGVFLLRYSDSPKWVGWMSIGFFGLGYPIGLFNLFDRRAQIIINDIGLFDRMAYDDFINWEVIRGAYTMTIHKQKFICLIVDEKFKPRIKKKEYVKQFSREIGAQELNIALGQINIDEEKLKEFILTMIKAGTEYRKETLRNKRLHGF